MNNTIQPKDDTSIKIKRLLYLICYFLTACIFIYITKPVYFLSILVVLLPPSVLNYLWLKNSRTRILLFSVLSTLLFAPPVELIARVANVWDVQSIFYRPFGLIPLENMLFAFINIFWGLSFYEYFIAGDMKKHISTKLAYLIALFVVFSTIVYSLFLFNKDLIGLNYFSIAFVIIVIPSVFIYRRNVSLLRKTIVPMLFFAFVFFVYELISLQIGSWWWPGTYLYSFNINGNIFPIDDVIIWYFLSTPVLIGGYEYFVIDNHH